MKDLQVFKNDDLKLQVRTMKNPDGSISINAEDAAKGFGFTQCKDNKVYIRWDRLHEYLKEFGFSPQVGKNSFIPESVFYLLGMKANNKVAQDFQKWLAIDVIPSIRKNGSYAMAQIKPSEIVAQMEALINDIEEKCSKLYRPACIDKVNICNYIKNRLGITKANEEYEMVKQRVLLKLKATKWEDIPVENLLESLNIIDESIRVIKLDRQTVMQTSIF